MAWHERAYYREQTTGGGGFGSRLSSASVVVWLLGINAAIFVLDMILTHGARSWTFSPMVWGNFNVAQALFGGQVWRWVTYQFLHVDFWHVLFNMIGLYFFGPMIEQWWGSKRFLAFYLFCGISGAVLVTLFSFTSLLNVTYQTPLVGASGSLFGILIAAAVLYPDMRVMLLFPPIPMKMRTMAIVFLGIAVLTIIVNGPNAGGQAAHLGGALLGFVLVKKPRLLDWADRFSLARWRQKRQRGQWQRQRERELDEEREVDRILDKVKDHGLQSLTRREKKTLSRATARQRRGE